uniref:Uncharacterized protein n=1 Tax=Anopheles merus TaxID=30066 RepID=A0A182UYF1_ANOME
MQFLNLSFYYIDPNFKSNQPEVRFGLITQQDDFQQQIVFREMTVQQFTHQFSVNPCHFIDARFIVLVTRSCFSDDRRNVIQFLNDQGILNYAIIPMPSSASEGPCSDSI